MIFIVLFTCEMLLKMYSLGLQVCLSVLNKYVILHINIFRGILCPFLTVLIVLSLLGALRKWF